MESDFGRSLDQLERAFSAKRLELDKLKQTIDDEKLELERLYKFKANVMNMNNIIRFLNEKSEALSTEYEEKKLALTKEYSDLQEDLKKRSFEQKSEYEVEFTEF